MKTTSEEIYSLAKEKGIVLYKEFISDSDINRDVYIDFKKLSDVCTENYLKNDLGVIYDDKSNILCAKIYEDKYKFIDARPFKVKFPKNISKEDLGEYLKEVRKKSMSRLVLLTTFLNPNVSNDDLAEYLEFVCQKMFDDYDYKIDREELAGIHIKARNYTENDIVFQEKKFKFINNFYKANLKVKMKIVNQGLYWDKSDEIHTKIRKAIYCLLETNDFIHSGNISKMSGVDSEYVTKYRYVFKDLIDPHNKAKFGTKVYTEYRNERTIDLINSAIVELENKGKKASNTNIAKLTSLHRNTISKNRNCT